MADGAICIHPSGVMDYYTTEDCAAGLRVIAPWMTYLIVPNKYVIPAPWADGARARLALSLPAYGGTITSAVIRPCTRGPRRGGRPEGWRSVSESRRRSSSKSEPGRETRYIHHRKGSAARRNTHP